MEDGTIGYFFSFLGGVITLWWVYRGIKRGLYPAFNIFLVFFIPLLITLNYYDLFFNVIGKIDPKSPPAIRETIAFCATYFVSFGLCVYFCLWLCSNVIKINNALDMAGGVFFGVATGVVSCGMLIMFWFALPFSDTRFAIDDGNLIFPAHKITMRAATFVATRPLVVNEEREFSGDRFLRDLRFGLPSMPTVGAGYYISSIPNGLRVFVDSSGYSPKDFLEKIKERLAHPERELTPSEKARPFKDTGRTPGFIELASSELSIGVVMDDIPSDIKAKDAGDMFISDGEIYYSKEMINDLPVFIKIYRVPRQVGVTSVIALFQPQDPKVAEEVLKHYLPSKNCYKFETSNAVNLLMQNNTTPEEAQRIALQLQMAGKIAFQGKGLQQMLIEVTGPNQLRVVESVKPDLESAEKERSRYFYYRPGYGL